MKVPSTRRGELPHASASAGRSLLAMGLMLVCVVAIYWPIPTSPNDNTLFGSDFAELHLHRLRYAREALLGPDHTLPGWYSRELCGTPFWSNVQNFPWIPSRLLILFLDTNYTLWAGVELAAILTAIFTFLYAREIGLHETSAAFAGFSFACAGFFAARILVGHLPLLEAYPALPLMFWLVERIGRQTRSELSPRYSLLALGLTCACAALAGHPQLPAYAIGATGLYAIYRLSRKTAVRTVTVMTLGVVCTAFVWLPMVKLIGLSTRVLPLEPPTNDVSLPYKRILAFVLPWRDGWPRLVSRGTPNPFHGYPGDPYFWDTVCYMGLLPVGAVVFMTARSIVRRKMPAAPWPFLAFLGALALLLALPFVHNLPRFLPVTLFRSPSRQLYLTSFCMALGLGALIEMMIHSRRLSYRWTVPIILAAIVFEVCDVGAHDRAFIQMDHMEAADPAAIKEARDAIGAGRVTFGIFRNSPLNREVDAIGGFDSIMLAKPYTALLEVSSLNPLENYEIINGRATLTPRAWAFAAVNTVITRGEAFELEDTAPRVTLVPQSCVIVADKTEIHRHLSDPNFELNSTLMLTPQDVPAGFVAQSARPDRKKLISLDAGYSRPSSDEVVVKIPSHPEGYVFIREAWHPGWSATVDDQPACVLIADDVFMAVAAPRGARTMRLSFSTPGMMAGMCVSLVGLCLLLLASLMGAGGPPIISRRKQPAPSPGSQGTSFRPTPPPR